VLFDTLGLLSDPQFLPDYTQTLRGLYVYLPLDKVSHIEKNMSRLQKMFYRHLEKVFVLANQVPLLELANLTRPYRTPAMGDRELGDGFRRFLDARIEERGSALQLVAFTDRNDLLSYNLKCWYERHVLRWSPTFLEKLARMEYIVSRQELVNAVTSCGSRQRTQLRDHLDEIWEKEEKAIEITDVTAKLKGIRAPWIMANPESAHSHFFQDELIHQLIACGGDRESRKARSCTHGFGNLQASASTRR